MKHAPLTIAIAVGMIAFLRWGILPNRGSSLPWHPDRHLDHTAVSAATEWTRAAYEARDCQAAHRLADTEAAFLLDHDCTSTLTNDRDRGGAAWTFGPARLIRRCRVEVAAPQLAARGRFDCVRLRATSRDCGAAIGGQPAQGWSKQVFQLFLRRTDDRWRVVLVDSTGSTTIGMGRLCTSSEIRRFRTLAKRR